MNISEDELEQRLRELFADERLDLPPPPEAGTTIVAGARRRRRRRQGVLAVTGVAAAVVAVSGGLTMVRLHAEDGTAVMSADGSSISVKPPENLTAGRQSQTPVPGPPTGTQDIEASSPPASPTSKASRPPSAQPSSKLPPVLSGPLLGSDGFGAIKLGMSETQIAAQGVTLTEAQTVASCTVYTAQGSGVPSVATLMISKAVGLTVVTPEQVAHTAEGIGAGSSKEQVLATYPAAKDESGGVVAPATDAADYHFRLGDSGVVQTSLMSVNQDCAG